MLTEGAYLINRDGEIFETILHVPSTTYISRGIFHLCPTDAQFLYDMNKISEKDIKVILDYCLCEYLTEVKHKSKDYTLSILDSASFNNYAELKYAPSLRSIFTSYANKFKNNISKLEIDKFSELNDMWYTWLQNNFIKLSIFNNQVEFRISSNDGYNWNDVIIDDVILNTNLSENDNNRYNIVREDAEGYKAYFINATLNEILENDDAILSSVQFSRRVIINGTLIYK